MHAETLLDRSLWPIVLTVAVVLVALSFAKGPLSGSGGTASALGTPLTLWVTGGETAGETETLAHQLAACGQVDGRKTTVGVLSGGSVEAVDDFLTEVHGIQGELLLLTSGLLADVAYDARQPADSEAGELGRSTAKLLRDTTPVAVLGNDAVSLAVRASSRIRTTPELLALLRTRPERPLLDLAGEAWLEGGLAALAQRANVQGAMPFDAFRSSREAVVSLQAREAQAVLAPHSALASDIRTGGLRELPWPSSRASAPKGWVAVLAPSGLGRSEIARLRSQASGLCAGGAWRQQLRGDGLSPVNEPDGALRSLIDSGLGEARRLQALAAATVKDY